MDSRSPRLRKTLSLVLLGPLLLLVAACYTVGEEPAPVLPLIETPQVAADRSACDQIYGTAFRSGQEQDWFMANCSKWEPVAAAAASAQNPGGERTIDAASAARCLQISGRPNASEEERRFYQAVCSTPWSVEGSNPQPGLPQQQPPQPQNPGARGPDQPEPPRQQGPQNPQAEQPPQGQQPPQPQPPPPPQPPPAVPPAPSGFGSQFVPSAPAPTPVPAASNLCSRGYTNAAEREDFLRLCR